MCSVSRIIPPIFLAVYLLSQNHENELAKALVRIKALENDYAALLSKVREGAYDQGPAFTHTFMLGVLRTHVCVLHDILCTIECELIFRVFSAARYPVDSRCICVYNEMGTRLCRPFSVCINTPTTW